MAFSKSGVIKWGCISFALLSFGTVAGLVAAKESIEPALQNKLVQTFAWTMGLGMVSFFVAFLYQNRCKKQIKPPTQGVPCEDATEKLEPQVIPSQTYEYQPMNITPLDPTLPIEVIADVGVTESHMSDLDSPSSLSNKSNSLTRN